MSKKLYSNTIYYVLISFLPMAVSIFTMPVMTRYLTPHDYGIFSVVAAFVTMVSIFASFQIYSGVSRFFFDYDEHERKAYFSTLFYTVSAIASAIFLIFLLVGDHFVRFAFTDDIHFFPYFFIGLANVFFNLSVGVTTAFFKVQQKARPLMLIAALTALLGTFISLLLVVYFRLGIVGGLLGGLISSFVQYLSHVIYMRKYFTWTFNMTMLKDDVKFGLPMIPHALGGYLFMYSDIILLSKFSVISAIGIYSIANRFASLLKVIVNAFTNALSPIFMKTAKSSINEAVELVYRTQQIWFILLAFAYFTLCLVGSDLVELLLPEAYHQSTHLLPILALAYVFRGIYVLHIYTFVYEKKTRYLPFATVTSGLLNVVLNIIFIPSYGIFGAACSTAFCFMINLLIFHYLQKNTFKLKFHLPSLAFLFLIVMSTNILFYGSSKETLVLKVTFQALLFTLSIGMLLLFNIGNTRYLLLGGPKKWQSILSPK